MWAQVGYGDVSPKSVAGRWLALAFLPFAVVFVGTQLGAIGDLFSGSAAEGALDKLMGLDLSVEVSATPTPETPFVTARYCEYAGTNLAQVFLVLFKKT